MPVRPLILLLTAAILSLVIACGGGDNDSAPSPTFLFEVPNPEYEPGSAEQQVSEALLDLYDKIGAADYPNVWNGYTQAYRDRCSFEAYVTTWDDTRMAWGWDELLVRGVNITVAGEEADAAFTVYPKASGEVLPGSAYSHSIKFRQESGNWLAEDRCY